MADKGGDGAVGTFQPSVVMAWVARLQSLVGSAMVCSLSVGVVVEKSEVWLRSAKVQPSLVSTVAVVDIFSFGRVSRGSPCGIGGRDRESFRNCGRGTRYGRGRGNQST